MKGKGGSKNNIANRGTGAKAKFFNGKKVIPVLLNDRKHNRKFMAAAYEDGKLAVGTDGNFIKFDSILSGDIPTANSSSTN